MSSAGSTLRSATLVAVGACAIALALLGCGRQESAADAHNGPHQVVEDQRAIRAEVSLDSAELTTAQRLTLTIDTSVRDGFDVRAADVQAALPENWQIAEDRTQPLGVEGGWRRDRRTVVVEPFLDGKFSIGPLELTAAPRSDGEAIAVRTDPMEVTVHSVLKSGDDAALAEVKSVVEPPAPDRTWLWAGIGAGALALASLGLWLALRKRAPVIPEPVRRPAHEVALERLDALLSAGLLECAQFKEFYSHASLILRRYIEDRFGVHAPKQTTEEFLAASRVSLALSRDDVSGLETFLRACDEIKFAAGDATRTQAESAAEAIADFVQRTRSAESLVVVDESEGQRMEVAA